MSREFLCLFSHVGSLRVHVPDYKAYERSDYWTPEQKIACCLLYVIYILLSWGTHLASAWGHLPLPDLQQRFEIGFLASQHSSDNVGAVVHCHSDSAAENSFILLASLEVDRFTEDGMQKMLIL